MASSSGDSSAESSGTSGLQPGNFPKGRPLGKGSSSSVYETTWNGERHARKDFVGVPSEIFVQEAVALVGLVHENLVRTYSWAVDGEECSLLVEYVEEDLWSLLQTEGAQSDCAQPLDLREALDIILQIAMGVECLHSKGIAHGDLKLKNIRVTRVEDGSGRTLKVVKVTNHGLVRIKRNARVKASASKRKLDIVRWKAPEHFSVLFKQFEDGVSAEFDSYLELPGNGCLAADVYSFAVTCAQILTGNDPYPDLDWTGLAGKILCELTRPNLPDQAHPQLRELLVSCWGVSADRPKFSEICEKLKELKASLTPESLEEPPGPPNDPTPDAEPSTGSNMTDSQQGMSTVSQEETSPPEEPLSPSSSFLSVVYGKPPEEAAQIGVECLISPLQAVVYTGFEILLHCALNFPDGRRAVFSATCARPPPASPEKAIAIAITNLAMNQIDPNYCKYTMKLMVALTSDGGAGPDRDMINMEVAKGLNLFIRIMKDEEVTKTRVLAAEAIANILGYREVRKAVRSQSGVVAAFVGISNVSINHNPALKRRADAVRLKALQRLAHRPEEVGFNEPQESAHCLEEGQKAKKLVAALLRVLQTGLGCQPELTNFVEDSLVALKNQLREIDKVAPTNHDAIRRMIFEEMSPLMVKKRFEAHTTVAGRMAIISLMSKLCSLYEDQRDVISAELKRLRARFKKEGGIDALLALLKNSDSKCEREFALTSLRDLDIMLPVAQLPFKTILSFLIEDWPIEVTEAAAGLLDSIIKDNPADCADEFMEDERALEATLSFLENDPDGPGGEKIASLLLGIASEKACLKIAEPGIRGLDILVRYVRNHVNDSSKNGFEELLTATLVRFCQSGHACQEAVIRAGGHVFLVTLLHDDEKEKGLKEKAAQGLLELLRNLETRGKVLEAGFVKAAMGSIDTKFACAEIAFSLDVISSDVVGMDLISLDPPSVSALFSLFEHCSDPKGKDAAAVVIASLYLSLDGPEDSARRGTIAERFALSSTYLTALFQNLGNSEVQYNPKVFAFLATIVSGSKARENIHEFQLSGLLIDNLLITQSDIQGYVLKILVEMTADSKSERLMNNIRRSFISGHMIADKLVNLLKSEEFYGRTENLKYALMLIRNLSLENVSELKLGENGSIPLLLQIIKRHQKPVSEVTGLAVKALEKFLYNPRAKQVTQYDFFRRKSVVFYTGMQVFLDDKGIETLAGILRLAVYGSYRSIDALAFSTIILTAVAKNKATRGVACGTIFRCDILPALNVTMSSCVNPMKWQAAVLLKKLAKYGPTADVCSAMKDKGCLTALLKLRKAEHCNKIADDVLNYVKSRSEVCRSFLNNHPN